MAEISGEFVYAGRKAAKIEQLQSSWPVYKNYDVVEEEGKQYIYAPLRPPELPKEGYIQIGQPDLNLDRMYSPLQDVPDLFLRFVSLMPRRPVSNEDLLDQTLNWVKSYGVLGSHAHTIGFTADNPRTLDYSAQRDRIQSVLEFWRAVREAAYCLRLYQAATANQGLADEEALSNVLSKQERRNIRSAGLKSVGQQRELALDHAQIIVHAHISQECYPAISRQWRRATKNTSETVGFFQGWGSRSLLGAMYLQMMWLMTSATNVKQCDGPGCINIITFDPPGSSASLVKGARGKYRTRIDKRFCSKNCKERWRYHNIIKPQRQAERSE